MRDKRPYIIVTQDAIDRIIRQIALDWSPDHAPGSRFKSRAAREFFAARDIAATLGIAETGARVGEWFHLDRADWDPEDRTLTFRRTKNGATRVVPVTRAYAEGPLAGWLAVRDKIKCGTERIFLTETRGPIDPGAWGKQWDKYRAHAGIERRIRRHDLRHFAATAHDRIDKYLSKLIVGHHTDAARAIYSHRELAELHTPHDAANPVGKVLARLAETSVKDSEHKTVKRRAYTPSK